MSLGVSDSDGKEAITEAQFEMMMEDPFNFFVTQQLSVGGVKSLTVLRQMISFGSGQEERLQFVLARLERCGLIQREGDRVEVLKKGFRFSLSKKSQARLIPSVFELGSKRACKQIEYGAMPPMMFVISEDDETRREVSEALQQFRARMREIGQNVKTRKPRGVRIVGAFTTEVTVGDFVKEEEPMQLDWTPSDVQKRVLQLSRAAHDIKPAIAALKQISRLMNEKLSDDTKETLRSAIERISKVSQEFLPSNQRRNTFRPTEVGSSLTRLVAEKKLSWNESVEVELNLSVSPCYAGIAEDEFERSISNLLDNAYDAVLAAGTRKIEIGLRQSPESHLAQLCINDNGVGISVDTLTKITDGMPVSTKISGNGIGLRTAISNINRSGGKVELCSQVGVGTTVLVSLPLL